MEAYHGFLTPKAYLARATVDRLTFQQPQSTLESLIKHRVSSDLSSQEWMHISDTHLSSFQNSAGIPICGTMDDLSVDMVSHKTSQLSKALI